MKRGEPRRPRRSGRSPPAGRLRSAVLGLGSLGAGGGDETLERMMSEMVNAMPLRALMLLSGGKPGFRAMHILVAVLNKRFLEALRLALGGRLPAADP